MSVTKLQEVLCLTGILLLSTTLATPPPGYVKKQDNDKDPPRYEYGYDVRDGKGSRQGHLESRDGEHALGLYYVKLPGGSGTSVRYFADDWGYHPLVSYSSSTKTSSTKAHFALGEKAVAALNKESQPTIDSLPAAGPSAAAVANSLDKIASSAGRAVLATGADILKVPRPSSSAPVGNGHGGTSHHGEGQADVSTANNLIDNNSNDKEQVQYSIVRTVGASTPSTPQAYDKSKEEQLGASGDEFSGINGLNAASYKIIDIGGAGNFYSESPSYLPLVSEPASGGSESESSSIQFGEDYSNVNSEVLSAQGGGNFGDRIHQKTVSASSTRGHQHVSGENSQNKQYGKEESVSYVTSTPKPEILQSHSIRPIVVADIYSKETEQEESVTQNQNLVEGSTKAPAFISSFPESPTNSLSGGFTVAGTSSYPSSSSGSSSFIYAISNGQSGNIHHLPHVSVPTAHEGQYISVTSDRQVGIPLPQHTTPVTLLFSSQNSNNGYYSEQQISETHSKEEKNSAYAEITASGTTTGHTTPATPLLVTYIQAESVPSGNHYSSSNASAQNLVYVTSTPTSVSNHLDVSDSSTTGGIGSSIIAHYSTPLSLFISQSHKASFEQGSSAIITSNNGQSGHIVPGTESSYSSSTTTTTPRPDENSFVSHSHDGEGASTTENYVVDPTPPSAVFVSTPQPIAASLTSSAQILAPLQAGVSLITSNNEKLNEQKSHTTFSTNNYQKLSLPQVKEEVDDLPAPKTIVEVQKAIPLDFYALKEQALRLGADTEKINRAQFSSSTNQAYQNAEISKSQAEQPIPQNQIQQQENQNVQTGNTLQYAFVEPSTQNSPFDHAQDNIQKIPSYPTTNQHILVVQQLQNTEQRENLEQIHEDQFNSDHNNRVLEAQNLLHQHQIDSENQKLVEVYNDHSQRLENEPAHLHVETTGFQSSSDGLSNLESEFNQQAVHDSGTDYVQNQFIDALESGKPYYLNAAQEVLVQGPVKQTVLSFNKRPEELERQLQSEYNQQLIEEQKQESIKLEELSKIHTEEQQRPQDDSTPLSIPVQPNVPVEQTHINVHVVEKAVALPITKLVPVERPVPFPHPVAVPVPYAIPHPVGVPLPHILPYPQLLTLPVNELHPLYFQGKQHPELGSTSSIHYHVQHFPSRTPVPTILKALQYGGGRYGVPVSLKQNALAHHHHHHQQHHLQGQSVAESNRVSHVLQLLPPPPPHKSQERGRPPQKARHHEFLKNLCIEYGFKPPLVPSIQIDDDTALSFAPPPQKE